jgi:hypothetical protein
MNREPLEIEVLAGVHRRHVVTVNDHAEFHRSLAGPLDDDDLLAGPQLDEMIQSLRHAAAEAERRERRLKSKHRRSGR